MKRDFVNDEPELIPGSLRVYRLFRFIMTRDVNRLSSISIPRILPARTRLLSPSENHRYEPNPSGGWYEAECLSSYASGFWPVCDYSYTKHQVPNPAGTCGFYAMYDPMDEEYLTYPNAFCRLNNHKKTAWVSLVASVHMSGRVILGTRGVRAQKMRIEALSHPSRILDRQFDRIEQYAREGLNSTYFYHDNLDNFRGSNASKMIAQYEADGFNLFDAASVLVKQLYGFDVFERESEMFNKYPPTPVDELIKRKKGDNG